MVDYSFLRLKDNLTSALDINDSPVTTHFFYNPIQLLPTKSYLQITNFDGGIYLDSDCEVFVVDCNDTTLADITDNVFIEEFIDSNGNNQCKIELVNLGVDFYRNTVLLKFDMLFSDAVFYSNPINITSYQSERTVFFKYKNYDDFAGIGYTNANAWQSISLSMYYDIPIDETETEDYFQISKNNTISARALEKHFKQYLIEQINSFTFERANKMFKHNLVYADNVRVTNKPVLSSDDRQGDSNVFATDVRLAKDYNDRSSYEFQVFEGLILSNYMPSGLYASGLVIDGLSADAPVDLTLNTGTASVYNSSGTLIQTFTESNMNVTGNQLKVVTIGSPVENLADGSYYVNISEGLVSGLGINNEAINDDSTWTFNIRVPDFASADFNNTDFFTN